jgi:hypothetical protein
MTETYFPGLMRPYTLSSTSSHSPVLLLLPATGEAGFCCFLAHEWLLESLPRISSLLGGDEEMERGLSMEP